MFTTNDKLSELFELESAGESFVLCRNVIKRHYLLQFATICGSYVVHVGLSQKKEPFSPI